MTLLAAIPIVLFGLATDEPPKPASYRGPVDSAYTAKIHEYTTEKFFLTELVDYLPAHPKVPTPERVLGYAIGAPKTLTSSVECARYLRELDKSSNRVQVFSLGKSEEGREMVVAVISDEGNMRRLNRLKEINALLGDPRRLAKSPITDHTSQGADEADAAAEKLVSEGIPFYWATAGLHSPETGPPEMVLELAYRLAVDESEFVRTIRKNCVVMLTPVVDSDGRDRVVDLNRWRNSNPDKPQIPLIYWGHYVAHDNNRDALTLALKLSQSVMKTWLDFKPQVMHDLHESVPFLYISTGTGPYNAWLDPITINEWQQMAYHEVQEMTKRGVPGVWTHDFYDGWAPSYMFYAANGHNAVGRFYETFGGGWAETGVRTVGRQTERAWFRPNPPLAKVNWSIRNNTNLMQSALLLGLNRTAKERELFLRNYYLKSKRSILKARTEGPAAYVLPGGDMRKGNQRRLLEILQAQGVEVHRLAVGTKTGDGDLPEGSFVVRMDQPYSRMADMMLDSQYYNPSDPRSYDDTGWQLGPLFDVKVVRCKDAKLLEAAMETVTSESLPEAEPAADASKVGRIALVHTWTSTQDEGWYRIAFDQLKIPYKYISVHEIRDNANLREKYDVILFPQARGSAQGLVMGHPKEGDPIPWKATPEFPNLGGPDETDNIRGGVELQGLVNLKRFVDDGGLAIFCGNWARVPIDYGLIGGVTYVQQPTLSAPGGVFLTERAEKESPVLDGFGQSLAVYFNANSCPILQVGSSGMGFMGRMGPSGPGQRASGRGSLSDPDVIQGRPPHAVKEPPEDPDKPKEPERPGIGDKAPKPTVLLKFAAAEKVLVSGMIDRPEELAGKAALVLVPSGNGHVLLFSFNPMWRGQTVGSYPLIFNAAMNFASLAKSRQ